MMTLENLREYGWLCKLYEARCKEIDKFVDSGVYGKEICKNINEDIKQIVKKRNYLIQGINTLSDIQLVLLMNLRYVNGYKWDEIAKKMGYSERHLFRLHDIALKRLKKI